MAKYILSLEFNCSTKMIDPLPIGTIQGVFNTGEMMTIAPSVRQKHMAIFGATGAGKSTLLRNMIAWDIAAGTGVSVVDPHGGLVDDLIDNHIPRHRIGLQDAYLGLLNNVIAQTVPSQCIHGTQPQCVRILRIHQHSCHCFIAAWQNRRNRAG